MSSLGATFENFLMILRHLFVQFAFLIGLAKYRRLGFADYRKIVPKWYWNSKKKQYASK